jgi:hypothetical protein
MKSEIITMCKYTDKGNVSYNFPPDKRNIMFDDRAFVYGLLCWYLAILRRNQVIDKPKDKLSDFDFQFRQPKIR